ncbi:hypothetical protein PIB30_026468 [Stylosanthes scabra]|uniref:Uncharacterized protein n=1 Tax=Stylosanthes scabra TaxID=79078 RepID=A0ABU6WDX4_9FABA|nr:hypothetical protein [Stylosanthes scabra]
MKKNKEKSKNRALARPHPPGGAAAQYENAIFLATGATVLPRPSFGAPARAVSLATFGRSYQAAGALAPFSWRVRRARAPARCPWCVRTVARVTLGRNSAIRARPRASGRASAQPRLLHTKECFRTLFLITLSDNTHSHPLSNSFGLNEHRSILID